MKWNAKTALSAALLLGLAAAAYLLWSGWREDGLGEGFVSGNGRIEATEIAIATKQAGRAACRSSGCSSC